MKKGKKNPAGWTFDFEPVQDQPLPYEAKNRNLIYPNYEPIIFSQDEGYTSEKALYDALYLDFEVKIRRIPVNNDLGSKKSKLFNQLKDSIHNLSQNGNPEILPQLNQVLYRCTKGLDYLNDIKNIEQLAILARELPGRVPNAVRIPTFALTGLLIGFCAVVIVAGILAIPATGGGSLLISAAAAVQLSTAASAIVAASTAAFGAAGIGVAAAGVVVGGATTYAAVKGNKAGLFYDRTLSKEVAEAANVLKKTEDDEGPELYEDITI